MRLFRLKFVLTLYLFLTALLCVFFFTRVDMSMPDWVSSEHPIQNYERLSDQEFDTRKEFVVVVDLKSQKPFYDFQFLADLDQLIDRLEEQYFVDSVNCFHTQQVITSQGESGLLVSSARNMLKEGYLKNELEYKNFILSQEDFTPRLVTESQRYIVLTVQLNFPIVGRLSLKEKDFIFDTVHAILSVVYGVKKFL